MISFNGGETGRPDDRRAAGSSFSPRQRISPSKESRTAQIGNPETQENRDPHRLSCKIDYFLRPNHGERSIASKFFTDDKVVFTLPIPPFDAAASLHADLADAAREAETVAKVVTLPVNVKFQRARKLIRDALTDAGIAPRIEALVAGVVGN